MYIKQAFSFRHDLWRYILGFFVVFLGSQFIGSIPFFGAIIIKDLKDGQLDFMNMKETDLYSFLEPNLSLFLILFMFVIGFVFLFFWVKWIHKQSFKTLHSAKQKIRWKRFFFSFILWGFISVAFITLDYSLSPEDYVWNFKPVPFLILVLIAIVFIPIQTSFEEYLFRGYLMQGIGVAAKNRWMPLLITSVVFGLMHIFNPEISKIGYIALVAYIGSGFLLGIMTLMDEGLELALGFHAANNLFAAILVTADWTVFQTHSLLKDTSEPSVGLEILIPVFVIYPMLLLTLAKVYKWKNWKQKLFGKIENTPLWNKN